jgi:N utilization substance protein A
VISHDANVDPKGACVGARGSRVRQVVNELRGEKVDVVQWRDDVAQFIAEALGPAKVKEVHIDEEEKTADVVVSEHQLSLAIGKEGQNARLAARLSGYKVDIRSDQAPEEVVEPSAAGEEVVEPSAAGEEVVEPSPADEEVVEPSAAGEDEETATVSAEQANGVAQLDDEDALEDTETDTESE